MLLFRICIVLLSGFLWVPVGVAAGLATDEKGYIPSLAPMLKRVTPSVVNIATSTTRLLHNPLLNDPFFKRFFEVPDLLPRYKETRSAGSGVILDAGAGIVMTNYHVISGADDIAVVLADGTVLKAERLGVDAWVDLAVLSVDADSLASVAPLSVAREDKLQVGDFVVAIGNPFGLGQTTTGGMVSALGRSGLGITSYEDLIQTDASINPGNSGGALVDLRGTLVGINTAIVSPSGGNVGIGFAIPVNIALAVMEQLKLYGEVRRGHLGLEVQGVNASLAEAVNLSPDQAGVIVTQVDPTSPASEAGIQSGDILLAINRQAVESVADFYGRSATLMVGDSVKISLQRLDRRLAVDLTIPDDGHIKVPGRKLSSVLAGAVFQNYRSPGQATGPAGVRALSVVPKSTLARRGLRAGDVLLSANGAPVRHLSDLVAAVKRGGALRVGVLRDGLVGTLRLR